MKNPVLQIKNLSVTFPSESGTVNAVRNVSLDIYLGEVLGVVGESEINTDQLISGVTTNTFKITTITAASSTATYSAPIDFLFDIHAGYRDWETDRKSTRLNSSH